MLSGRFRFLIAGASSIGSSVDCTNPIDIKSSLTSQNKRFFQRFRLSGYLSYILVPIALIFGDHLLLN